MHARLACAGIAGLAGIAVLVVVACGRESKEAVVADQRRAECAGARFDETVALLAERRVVVVLIAVDAVGVQHQCAVRAHGIDTHHAGAALIDAVVTHLGAAGDGLV